MRYEIARVALRVAGVLGLVAIIVFLAGGSVTAVDPTLVVLLLVGALLVPDVGEVQLLTWALTAEAIELDLFVSNTTPAEGDTFATYTLATGGGYAQKVLAILDWTIGTSAGTSSAVQPEQTFTFTGPLTTNVTIYGYLLHSAADVLLWAERAAATFEPTSNGDTYKVTVRLEAA